MVLRQVCNLTGNFPALVRLQSKIFIGSINTMEVLEGTVIFINSIITWVASQILPGSFPVSLRVQYKISVGSIGTMEVFEGTIRFIVSKITSSATSISHTKFCPGISLYLWGYKLIFWLAQSIQWMYLKIHLFLSIVQSLCVLRRSKFNREFPGIGEGKSRVFCWINRNNGSIWKYKYV